MIQKLLVPLLCLIAIQINAQLKSLEFPVGEMKERIEELNPTEEDYQFVIPEGWGENLMTSAKIEYYSENDNYEA